MKGKVKQMTWSNGFACQSPPGRCVNCIDITLPLGSAFCTRAKAQFNCARTFLDPDLQCARIALVNHGYIDSAVRSNLDDKGCCLLVLRHTNFLLLDPGDCGAYLRMVNPQSPPTTDSPSPGGVLPADVNFHTPVRLALRSPAW